MTKNKSEKLEMRHFRSDLVIYLQIIVAVVIMVMTIFATISQGFWLTIGGLLMIWGLGRFRKIIWLREATSEEKLDPPTF